VHHDLANASSRRSIREHPIRRHDIVGIADGDGEDGLSGLVGHFEGAVFEGHEAVGAGARSFREGAEVYSVVKPPHTLLQGKQLTSPIRSIDQDVLCNLDRLTENWHLFQFFLGYEFVIVPSDGITEEGNVHP